MYTEKQTLDGSVLKMVDLFKVLFGSSQSKYEEIFRIGRWKMNLEQLNEPQRDAVCTPDGNLLILAGAGSGKTKVITHRIAYLIEEGISPSAILALTFTNKAAREMKERMEVLLGVSVTGMWIGTFHSMFLRILRAHIDKLGYDRNFVVYDTYDQTSLIKECMKVKKVSDKVKPSFFLSHISDWKNELKFVEGFPKEELLTTELRQAYDVYEMYQKRLAANNALDFDDILLLAFKLLKEFEEVREKYQTKFRHVLVDEYQDTNYLQYQLINLIAGKHRNLCVVGDDDQSIYAWRGADIRNILEFEKDHKDAKVIRLEQNYRSTQTILNAAHDVISKNTGRMRKKLWTSNGDGEPITLKKVYSEQDEGVWISNEIHSLHRKGVDFSEIAILYRTNAQSRAIEDALVLNDLPYQVYGGMKFYDRKEIKDILAYLRLVSNTGDDVSLKRIVNVPRRGIGLKTIEKLEVLSEQAGLSIYQYILNDAMYDFSPKQRTALKDFIKMMETFRVMAQVLSFDELIEKILSNSGYYTELQSDKSDESRSRLENLGEFMSVAKDYEKNKEEEEGIADFLNSLSLATDQDDSDTGGRISLMTLHSAKGLEFEAVFIAGMEDGLFPSARSVYDELKLEEERRLCYVGVTRAKKKLYLSYATKRTLYGKTEMAIPSRFLKDISPEYLKGDAGTSLKGQTASIYEKYRKKYKAHIERAVKEEKKDGQDFAPGSKVKHKVFGTGTVVAGEKGVYTIVFESKGIKKIDTSLVELHLLK